MPNLETISIWSVERRIYLIYTICESFDPTGPRDEGFGSKGTEQLAGY